MAENKAIWNKVGISGTYRGHPSGPFSLSAQTFAEIEKNFKADNIPIPIDWDHAMEQPVSGSIAKSMGEAPAAGWVRDVQARGSELWAFTEWLPETREKIKSGAYKFVSPAIRFGAVDPVSGKNVGARLSSLACTNRPFLRALPPLQANDATGAFLCSEVTGAELIELSDASGGYAVHQNEYLPRFRRMLQMDDMASPSDMADKVDRLRELCQMADGDPSAVVEGVPLGNYIPQMRDYMRMPANTTLAELLDAVCDMICSCMDDADVDDDDSTGAALSEISLNAPQQPTTPTAPVTNQDTKSMSETTITLADHEAKVAAATAPLTLQKNTLEAKVADLTTQLSDETAKVTKLNDEIKVRDAAVAAGRVDEAFETYKETRKLSDKEKKAMTVVLASDPALFEELYPKLAPSRAVLLRTLSEDKSGGASSAVTSKEIPDLKVLLADVQAKFPKLAFEEQFSKAYAEHNKLMAG